MRRDNGDRSEGKKHMAIINAAQRRMEAATPVIAGVDGKEVMKIVYGIKADKARRGPRIS